MSGSAEVPSPCTKVCQMDRTGQVCTGCHRTTDEITRWSEMSEDEKRAVWRRLRRLRDEPPADR